MKTTLLKILQVNKNDYEQLVFDLYFDWCSTHAKNQRQLQKLLIAQPLFNWWYKELQSLENKFLEHTKCFNNSLSAQVSQQYYRDTIADIYTIFSKPLIKKAYDSKSVTKQN